MSDQLTCRCYCAEWHIWRGDIECSKCGFRVSNLIPDGAKMREGLAKAIKYLPENVTEICLQEE
jgi:hypothetical protein